MADQEVNIEATEILAENQRSNSSFSSQSSQSIQVQRVWNFNYGVFHQNRITSILNYIGEAFVEEANLGTNESENIIHPISHINFPYLRILNLQTNHIKSIEVLECLRVPELKELNLRNNLITNLRVLRKVKWPKLERLILQKNSITSCGTITESDVGCLEKLLLQNDTDEKISEDLSHLVKINSIRLKELSCPSKKRVIDQHLFYQMKNKHRKTIPNHDQNEQMNYSQLIIIQTKKHH